MRGRPRKHPTPVLDPCAPVRMRGRPRKHPENHSPERPLTKSHAPARKRGRPRKHPKTFSPAPAPGLGAPVRKRGRPRKYPGLDRKDRFEAAVEPQDQPFIHFRPEDGVAVQARKRGRPRKHPVREVTGQELAHHMRSNTTVPEAFVITGSVEKTRTELEPRRISSKATLHAVTGLAPGEFVWALDGVSASTGTKRKRGRPPRRRQSVA
ncbi:hypothetical protein BDV98DRAFT_91206 [Pterulicium gracile]|uniref:Uncharacterized protein n=1 Tax=Pterulicium gracile TaxID=1884261 RepID=A0A5C3QGL5_9AGAR|nr:hypothetical protein BDV98DRAFT_91206 [Pterula gracilis]